MKGRGSENLTHPIYEECFYIETICAIMQANLADLSLARSRNFSLAGATPNRLCPLEVLRLNINPCGGYGSVWTHLESLIK